MQPELAGGVDIAQGIVADVQDLPRVTRGDLDDEFEHGRVRLGAPRLLGVDAVVKEPLQRRPLEFGGAVGHRHQGVVALQTRQRGQDIGVGIDLVAKVLEVVDRPRRQLRVMAELRQQPPQLGLAQQVQIVGDGGFLSGEFAPLLPQRVDVVRFREAMSARPEPLHELLLGAHDGLHAGPQRVVEVEADDLDGFRNSVHRFWQKRWSNLSAHRSGRIKRTLHGESALLYHMRVDHGSGDIRVSKQFLNHADILARHQQVGGK